MRLQKYLNESNVEKVKKEIQSLRSYQAKGKLKPAGVKRLEQLENYLIKMEVFDF